jgi:hypothetical protein
VVNHGAWPPAVRAVAVSMFGGGRVVGLSAAPVYNVWGPLCRRLVVWEVACMEEAEG